MAENPVPPFTMGTPAVSSLREVPMLNSFATYQARSLHQTLTRARVSVHTLWWRYFSLGGNVGHLEIDAYVHQCLDLPRSERDLLDHAAFELITM
ncbi:hypothetical protein [Kocuria himachalensis]